MDFQTIFLKKNQILFLANEVNNNLYLITKGRVMVFLIKGSQITPLAYAGPKEYIGELSLFDNKEKSAGIICIEESEFRQYSYEKILSILPNWAKTIGHGLSLKIRQNDELIRSKGFRKSTNSIAPLSIQEQTHYFKIIEDHLGAKRP